MCKHSESQEGVRMDLILIRIAEEAYFLIGELISNPAFLYSTSLTSRVNINLFV